ncbi:hypothetical protein E4P24_02795 [Haloferax sp. AS1]|uniref:hypothetical protein n=1 Tax=Haloferax sp. AS1 TaxID=2562277 RepID=UPI00165EFF6D|nr:hypothetical protein [Haloferax sp. AS1]MBC9985299.1 hypothetical protein [Haloferax sp. AS1]
MYQDEAEVFLKSTEGTGDYTFEVTLRITAYFRGDNLIDENTLAFHCDPIGSNYNSSFLQVTFDDWSKVVAIRDFLADCFSEEVIRRQAMTVDIEDGISSITPWNQSPNEKEGLEEMTIQVEDDRIEFMRSGTVLPYIFTYEESNDGGKDNRNAEKLLNFFDKIISLHPDFDPDIEGSENPGFEPLFDQHRVQSLLNEVVSSESDLFCDYQKAVREFEDEEYGDTIRDLGRAAEKLIEILSVEIYDEEDLSSNMAGRLNKLDKTEEGLPSLIGKTISPLWWLRNQISHANEYEITEEEALYALLCFQMASEKLIGGFLNKRQQ